MNLTRTVAGSWMRGNRATAVAERSKAQPGAGGRRKAEASCDPRRLRPASRRCRWTCSPPRTSTSIESTGPTSGTQRCNTPNQLWQHNLRDNPLGFWGDCNVDIPIEKIVSPYPYKTAEEHYNALLAETKKTGGPTTAHVADAAEVGRILRS